MPFGHPSPGLPLLPHTFCMHLLGTGVSLPRLAEPPLPPLLGAGQYPKNHSTMARGLRRVGKALRLRRNSSFSGGKRPGQMLDKGALRTQAAWAVDLLHAWRGAVAVIDEVDVVLHPLRSELNWPLGDKHTLDFAPTR